MAILGSFGRGILQLGLQEELRLMVVVACVLNANERHWKMLLAGIFSQT